jgi:hypothetical protein
MRPRFDVHQHLIINSVFRDGACVAVEVTDGDGTTHWINWSFDDVAVARRRVRVVERWKHLATRLTFVRGDGESVLVDDEALFRAATG